MCALCEPLPALKVLKTELEESNLVSQITIKDYQGKPQAVG